MIRAGAWWLAWMTLAALTAANYDPYEGELLGIGLDLLLISLAVIAAHAGALLLLRDTLRLEPTGVRILINGEKMEFKDGDEIAMEAQIGKPTTITLNGDPIRLPPGGRLDVVDDVPGHPGQLMIIERFMEQDGIAVDPAALLKRQPDPQETP
jgi:hypothetical protein